MFVYCKNRVVRIFYGGAIAGNIGGPLVKVSRLRVFFPQFRVRFNVVYALSNAPYIGSLGQWILNKKKRPLILNQNGVYFPGWYEGDYVKMNSRNKDLYHNASYVFWQSKFCKLAANKFLGKREGPGEILFNAVDLNIYKPTPKRNNNFTFLVLGKFDVISSYRIIDTIHAFHLFNKKIDDSRLLVAGFLPKALFKKCVALIKHYQLESSVTFYGEFDQHVAPNIYNKSHSYIHLKYMDSCPNTVIEAMACGLPVIATNTGGCSELVKSDNGYLIEAISSFDNNFKGINAHLILKGMNYIYLNYQDLSLASRLFAKSNFNIDHWVDRHKNILEHYSS